MKLGIIPWRYKRIVPQSTLPLDDSDTYSGVYDGYITLYLLFGTFSNYIIYLPDTKIDLIFIT